MFKRIAILVQVGLLLGATGYPSFAVKKQSRSTTHYLDRSKRNFDWKFIDKQGNEIAIDPSYREIGSFRNGLASFATKIKGKWKYGYIDTTGQVVLKPRFKWASEFKDRRAVVELENGRYAIIDTSGAVRLEIPKGIYPALYPGPFDSSGRDFFNSGRLLIADSEEQKKKYGYMNQLGKIEVPMKYDRVRGFFDGLAAVERNKKWGFVDFAGKEVIPPQYSRVSDFSEERALVEGSKNSGVIDTTGKLVFPEKLSARGNRLHLAGYTGLGNCSGGLISFVENGKLGYKNKDGKVVIKPKFERGYDFVQGLARVQLNGKWGYINKEGNFAVAPQFAWASDRKLGTSVCAKNVDRKDNNASRIIFYSSWNSRSPYLYNLLQDRFEPFPADYFLKPVIKFGVMSGRGWIVPPKYDAIYDLEDGTRRVLLDSKYGFIDLKGKEIIKPQYSAAVSFNSGVARVKSFSVEDRKKQLRNRDPVLNFMDFPGFYEPLIEPELLEANIDNCSKVIEEYPESSNALYLRAKFYFYLRRYDKAILDIEKAVSRDSENCDFLVLRAKLNLKLKKWKDAEQDFRSAIKAYQVMYSPHGSIGIVVAPRQYYEGLQLALIMQNKFREYKKIPSGYGIIGSPTLELVTSGVEVLINDKKYSEAERLLIFGRYEIIDNVLYPRLESELDTKYSEISDQLEELKSKQNTDEFLDLKLLAKRVKLLLILSEMIGCKNKRYKVVELEKLYKKRIELLEDIHLYNRHFKKNDKSSIYSHFRSPSVPSFPFHSIHIETYRLASFYSETNQDKKAEALYQKLMKTGDRNAFGAYGFLLSKQRKFYEAEKFYGKSNHSDFNNLRKAFLLKRLGKPEDSEKIIMAERKKAYNRMGLQIDSKQKTKNDDDCSQTFPVTPIPSGEMNAATYLEFAKRSNDFGLVNASIRYLEKAESLSQVDDELKSKVHQFRKLHMPPQKVSLKTCARYYQNCLDLGGQSSRIGAGINQDESWPIEGLYFEKRMGFERCIKEEPSYTHPYVALMRVHNNVGNFDDAAKVFEQVIKVNPDCLGAWVEAGRMYNLQGKKTKTKEAFLKVQELDPENQYAKVILDSLQ